MKTPFLIFLMFVLAGALIYVLVSSPAQQGPTRQNNEFLPPVNEERSEVERSSPENLIVDPIKDPVGQTTPINSIDDVESSFNTFTQTNNLNWRFLESEVYEQSESGTSYKVTYQHYELSGGKRRVVIDSQGTVYALYGLP